tara:strand:+ start:237 stop:449 length:213 start_codon:yes stop_codon:yes gene_type:complete
MVLIGFRRLPRSILCFTEFFAKDFVAQGVLKEFPLAEFEFHPDIPKVEEHHVERRQEEQGKNAPVNYDSP